MRYEVIEDAGEWIVRREGRELARFGDQDAALHDVALLSAMYGMFAGAAHAFALLRKEDIDPTTFAPLLADWLTAMAPAVHQTADQLRTGDYTKGVVSTLAMQVAGTPTFLTTARDQGVSPELLTPYFTLMQRRLTEATGGGEDLTGVIDLLLRPEPTARRPPPHKYPPGRGNPGS